MARVDYGIEEARATMENVASGCDKTVLIVAEYPDINYVLAYRGGKYQPWVAAWSYKKESNSWGQGHYFERLESAIEYIRMKQGRPTYYRLEEIATKAIDGLIEDDPYEAEEYLKDEMEITFEEAEYFGIAETMDMAKRLEYEDWED